MPENNGFTHLPLPLLFQGKPKLHGGGSRVSRTEANKNNRGEHGAYVKRRATELSRFWTERRATRLSNNLPEIETGIPVLLEIDPSADINFLRGLGFEIVCEIEEGFIIVATDDIDFAVLNEKTDAFIANIKARCNTPARVYALCEDNDRLRRVLSEELYAKWDQIQPEVQYYVDIGVSCCGETELPKRPQRGTQETDEHYLLREQRWEERCRAAYREWDELKEKREETIREFIREYDGEIMAGEDDVTDFSRLPDSFSARLKVSGACLLDLVLNFAYIFEVSEAATINMGSTCNSSEVYNENVQLHNPLPSAPVVCIVDSGIQEEHKYIAPAILEADSISMVMDDNAANDEVWGGGHGTRVAGAVLYPENVPTDGEYQLPCWIRNMRVLDANNCMPQELYPPKVIETAVKKFSVEMPEATRIFNHSIGSRKSCEMRHMSPWAAEIDYQSYHNDVLFIQASGNVSSDIIAAYMQRGYMYPEYLGKELCRVSDPAQSLQALTVGSVSGSDLETEDSVVLGKKGEVSSFSRIGPGIWDVIKPDVVEYGGTHVYVKGSTPPQLTTPIDVCPELIRKSPEGPAFSRDEVGTSFAAPKVTYIASQIARTLPDAPTLLYRALIAQSARWPKSIQDMDPEECVSTLRQIGFGIPDVERATHNDDYRITLITPDLAEIGDNEAHVFQVPIPEEISSVGEDHDILVEITLSYAANPRRTRRYVKGYLSTWVEWCCSRIGESADTFVRRIFETGSTINDDGDFQWVLGEASNRGVADGFSRKYGTLQKDWCVVKSHQLADAFCIAVRGHKGWGGLFKAKYSLAVSFEAINHDVAIYEPIRSEVELLVDGGEIRVEMPEEN